jgi:TolB-like protein
VEQNGTEPANRPSIAVLPFVSPDDARGEDYFADGLVDDLMTNLSKIRGPFVIARNSSFAYSGQAFVQEC